MKWPRAVSYFYIYVVSLNLLSTQIPIFNPCGLSRVYDHPAADIIQTKTTFSFQNIFLSEKILFNSPGWS
jgi:hypothetical protein